MGKNSPALSPFVSFPAVLGHELVGRVVELPAPAVMGANGPLRVGDRVVVDPALGCRARGLDPCPACRRGEAYLCERSADGTISPGMILGFCRDLPGSWAEEMVAPAEQVFRVPDEVSSERAVLVEPFSIGLRAVLRGLQLANGENGDGAGSGGSDGSGGGGRELSPRLQVLIIGGGTIGLTTLAAIHLLGVEGGIDAGVTVLARHRFQRELALELGATRVVANGTELVRTATEILDVRTFRPVIGPPVYTGGFDLVFDCVGSRQTIDQALRLTRAGGRIVLVGAAGELPGLDWTFVWTRELTIIGSYGYGVEYRLAAVAPSLAAAVAPAPHTFAVALELLRRHPGYPLERLVTHRFPLSEWRQALATNVCHGPHRAVKSVFVFPDRVE